MNNRAEEGHGEGTVMVPRQPARRGSLHGQPVSAEAQHHAESRRAGVRDALGAALRGAVLSSRDRQFLTRLVKWDKRNAASVVSLLWRARLAGRAEAALTPRQLEVVLGALSDAAEYLDSGVGCMGCWNCENVPGGRCAEHAKDLDRAKACSELAGELAAGKISASEVPQPSDVSDHHRFATVAF
jgi:hypothetical protein